MNREEYEDCKLIAKFMGYVYYHPGVDFGLLEGRKEIFSKTPILVNVYDDQVYFSEIPNPDFGKDNSKWNKDLQTLPWSCLNDFITREYFHNYIKDMNILMEIVDKIESIGENDLESDENYHVHISKRIIRFVYDWKSYSTTDVNQPIDTNSHKDYKYSDFEYNRAKTLFRGIVDFIKWYNGN